MIARRSIRYSDICHVRDALCNAWLNNCTTRNEDPTTCNATGVRLCSRSCREMRKDVELTSRITRIAPSRREICVCVCACRVSMCACTWPRIWLYHKNRRKTEDYYHIFINPLDKHRSCVIRWIIKNDLHVSKRVKNMNGYCGSK